MVGALANRVSERRQPSPDRWDMTPNKRNTHIQRRRERDRDRERERETERE